MDRVESGQGGHLYIDLTTADDGDGRLHRTLRRV